MSGNGGSRDRPQAVRRDGPVDADALDQAVELYEAYFRARGFSLNAGKKGGDA